MTGREWHWHPQDFSLFEDDTRTPDEKKQHIEKTLNEIPDEAKGGFIWLYVSMYGGVLLLLILCLL